MYTVKITNDFGTISFIAWGILCDNFILYDRNVSTVSFTSYLPFGTELFHEKQINGNE